jgi:hypothetical protein
MFKKTLMAAIFIIAATNETFSQRRELTVETLVSVLKSLGIYSENKVPIAGQTYILKNVSIEKGSHRDEFVIKFTAKPID